MAIECALLMCHAPIVIPEVGGTRGLDCENTTVAMQETAQVLVDSTPDVLVVLSPHSPRARSAWALHQGAKLFGSMSRFGAPQTTVELPIANEAVELIHSEAAEQGLKTWRSPAKEELDHGAAVPLIFAQRAGWQGPTVLIALPWESLQQEALMGKVLAAASNRAQQRWTILASGDMSHRLIPGAPAGFHPQAKNFDRTFVDLLSAGDYRGLQHIDTQLREHAAEDCVQTAVVASAAVEWKTQGARFLHYEGPFGVGYSEAILYDSGVNS